MWTIHSSNRKFYTHCTGQPRSFKYNLNNKGWLLTSFYKPTYWIAVAASVFCRSNLLPFKLLSKKCSLVWVNPLRTNHPDGHGANSANTKLLTGMSQVCDWLIDLVTYSKLLLLIPLKVALMSGACDLPVRSCKFHNPSVFTTQI